MQMVLVSEGEENVTEPPRGRLLDEKKEKTKLIVDALPYVDEECTPETEEIINKMIEEEMKAYVGDKDYLERFGAYEEFSLKSTELLRNEWKRISKGETKMQPLDLARYSKSYTKLKTLEESYEAINLTKIQLQYHQNRVENLELLKLYGSNCWKVYNDNLIYIEKQLQQSLDNLKSEIEQVNWQRKKEQTEAGYRLTQLEEQWKELVTKNLDIEKACLKLEEQIAALENGAK